MSITRIYGKIVFICDSCDEPLQTDEKDFEEAREVLKVNYWHTSKDKTGNWTHYCDECF